MAILAIAPGLVGLFLLFIFGAGCFTTRKIIGDHLLSEWLGCGIFGAALIASALALMGVTL